MNLFRASTCISTLFVFLTVLTSKGQSQKLETVPTPENRKSIILDIQTTCSQNGDNSATIRSEKKRIEFDGNGNMIVIEDPNGVVSETITQLGDTDQELDTSLEDLPSLSKSEWTQSKIKDARRKLSEKLRILSSRVHSVKMDTVNGGEKECSTFSFSFDGSNDEKIVDVDSIEIGSQKKTLFLKNGNGAGVVQFNCDTNNGSKCFSMSFDGDIGTAFRKFGNGFKGFDGDKLETLGQKFLELNLKLKLPDSAGSMSLNAFTRDDSIVHGDFNFHFRNLKNNLKQMRDENNVDVEENEVESTVDSDPLEISIQTHTQDGENITVLKNVYRIKINNGRRERDAKVTTERSVESDGLKLSAFELYPNPTDGIFNLKFTSADISTPTITVRDVHGKELYTEKPRDFTGRYEKPIDVSQYGAGTYIISVMQSGKTASLKVLIE